MNYTRLLNNKLFKEALLESEKEVYLKTLEYTKGNQSAAAKLLGVARGTVINKLKSWAT